MMSRGDRKWFGPPDMSAMGKYVARRLSLMVVAAIGVTLISFVISHSVPADPIVSNLGQQALSAPRNRASLQGEVGSRQATARAVRRISGKSDARGAGRVDQHAARDHQGPEGVPACHNGLSTIAVLFALALGVPLGIAAAIYRESVVDHAARMVSLVGVSLPIFWLATVSLVIFHATLQWTVGPSRLSPRLDAPPFSLRVSTPSTVSPTATTERSAMPPRT